jgi:hypothetical protein
MNNNCASKLDSGTTPKSSQISISGNKYAVTAIKSEESGYSGDICLQCTSRGKQQNSNNLRVT